MMDDNRGLRELLTLEMLRRDYELDTILHYVPILVGFIVGAADCDSADAAHGLHAYCKPSQILAASDAGMSIPQMAAATGKTELQISRMLFYARKKDGRPRLKKSCNTCATFGRKPNGASHAEAANH